MHMKTKKSLNRSAVIACICMMGSMAYAQNIGVNTTGAAPNVSALLDVDAAPTNDKGILIPRVTLTQTTSNAPVGASVATSLMVYNTATLNDVTPGYYYWDGTKWVRLLGNNNAWLLLGNAGTTAGTNFLGTTDAQDMVFKTNSTEWMRILANGNVGVHTTTPDAEFEVVSTSGTMPRGSLISQYNNGVLSDAQLWFRRARGTETVPLALQANDEIGFVKFRGYDGTTFSTNDQTEMGALATENWSTTANGGCLKFMTTLNGTTAGVERMRIDHTGNVGIGTSTPAVNLEVWANDFQTAVSIINASSTVGRNPRLNIYDYGSGGGGVLQFNTGRGTQAVPAVVLQGDALGKVEFAGWNTLSMQDAVQVRGYATENWSAAGSGGQFVVRTVPNATPGAPLFDRFVVNHDGKVGIATMNPSQFLQVGELLGGSTATPYAIDIGGDYSNTPGTNLKLRIYDDGTNIYGIGVSAFQLDYSISNNNINNRHVFYYGTTELMRIQGNGDVGINTGSPLFKLDVNGTGRFVSDLRADTKLVLNSDPANYYIGQGIANGFIVQTWDEVRYQFNGGGSNISFKNGTLGIGTTAPTAALHVVGNICYTGGIGACSDARYKKNFNPIENALQNVLKMNGLTYNWRVEEFPDNKFTTDKQIGFIAQDLEKIYPEIVITDKNGYKSVDYAKLTPILVEAIKEQQRIIEGQQSTINDLKADNKNFKAQYDNRLKVLEEIIGTKSAQK